LEQSKGTLKKDTSTRVLSTTPHYIKQKHVYFCCILRYGEKPLVQHRASVCYLNDLN
jgi:hypothetical protein